MKKNEEEYTVLTLTPQIAPIKVGVFPLINDERLMKVAQEIDIELRNQGIATYYDEGGTIGRRYARMDEIGTPFCITVDHDTLKDHAVTIRDRDTTKQERIKKEKLVELLKKKISF
jgi:glycyl-tRNA synthetase